MKHPIHIICMSFFLLNLSTLPAQNKLDSLSRRTGKWVFETESDPAFGEFTVTQCEYLYGQKNGTCIITNRYEEVLAEVNFLNDKKNGHVILYDNRKIDELTIFRNDTLVSREAFIKGRLFKTEYFIPQKDTVVLDQVIFFQGKGGKWMLRKYKDGQLKKEVVYNRKGWTKMITEYDDKGVSISTKY